MSSDAHRNYDLSIVHKTLTPFTVEETERRGLTGMAPAPSECTRQRLLRRLKQPGYNSVRLEGPLLLLSWGANGCANARKLDGSAVAAARGAREVAAQAFIGQIQRFSRMAARLSVLCQVCGELQWLLPAWA